MTKLLAQMFRRRAYRCCVNINVWLRDRGWQYHGAGIWEHPRHGRADAALAVFEQHTYERRHETLNSYIAMACILALNVTIWVAMFLG